MKVKVIAKGKQNSYYANGIYDGKGVIVLKGSSISSKVAKKIQPIVAKVRNNPEIVSKDMILLQDINFRSASTAASFVTGNISNGKRVWRTENGIKLKEWENG